MGHAGGDAPSGLKQREIRTFFLRAPYHDWTALAQGFKQEFRTSPQGVATSWLDCPIPVVLYSISPQLKRKTEQLMVLVERRSERLCDIAEDRQALMREGFETYRDFRRYWRRRTRRPYRPAEPVEVFRLAPWQQTDRLRLGMRLCDYLYGAFMPHPNSRDIERGMELAKEHGW